MPHKVASRWTKSAFFPVEFYILLFKVQAICC
jgi:hypothetical protein